MKNNRYTQQGGDWVAPDYVQRQEKRYAGSPYPLPKYIQFIKKCQAAGFRVRLKDSPRTVSKYVTVWHRRKSFKVRFSNHKPIEELEMQGSCDFFVGVTHTGVRTWEDAYARMTQVFQAVEGDHKP